MTVRNHIAYGRGPILRPCKTESPTAPGTVTPATNVQQLNLNWHEHDLAESERTKHVHRLHPYLGKYIPQLVEVFLRKYFTPGQRVYDPFCGSGTTLVQALEMGVHSLGCDISPFNVLLSEAKTRRYAVIQLKQEIADILLRTRKACTALGEKDRRASLPGGLTTSHADASSTYLKTWFSSQALNELLAFRLLISDYENQDILKIILTRAARSARMTAHHDLDFPKSPQLGPYYCYKHKRLCQPAVTALPFLVRYSHDTVQRIEAFATLRTDATVKIFQGDSRFINPGPFDGVITSPPYVGLIDYHEQHRYAYELLGLKDQSDKEIGPASKGASLKAKQVYQNLMAEVFLNVLQFMPPGGRLIIVAADRHGLYPGLAKRCGLEVEAAIERRVNRRTGMRPNDFHEHIFIWRK